jgi:hypothetical protein
MLTNNSPSSGFGQKNNAQFRGRCVGAVWNATPWGDAIRAANAIPFSFLPKFILFLHKYVNLVRGNEHLHLEKKIIKKKKRKNLYLGRRVAVARTGQINKHGSCNSIASG